MLTRVLREDRALQLAEAVARLDSQLLDQPAPRVLVRLQGVRLTVAAVEGEHQLRAQVLAVGMLRDQRLQLSDDLGVLTELELGVDQLLERGEPQLVQACDLGLGERLVGEVVERPTAPQRQSLLEHRRGGRGASRCQLGPALGEEPLEPVGVERLRIEPQLVPPLARDELGGSGGAGQRLAQARHVHLERLGWTGGRVLPPELVDQTVGAQGLVGVDEEQREQRPLLAASERNLAPFV
jgi:hypothetical protein